MPQNRPRVLIIGYRKDVWENYTQRQLEFAAEDTSPNAKGGSALKNGLLPNKSTAPPTLKELLSNLVDPDYIGGSTTTHYPASPDTEIQKWLRTSKSGKLARRGAVVTEQEYSAHSAKIVEKFEYMLHSGGEIPEHLKTKKFAQRVLPKEWNGTGPNITATSLPDDYVHFSQPRVPTVREWARIQTFPDWYQFAGPRTTGGRRRAGDPDAGLLDREVTKYTQIGNAVPVLLANKVAKHVRSILEKSL